AHVPAVIVLTGTPGGHVRLRVAGCAGGKAVARSAAFVADAPMTMGPVGTRGPAGLFTEATVRPAAAPGTYPVRVDCDGDRSGKAVAEGRLTVTAAGTGRGGHSPVAPVPAGGGGTAAAPAPPGTPGLIVAGTGVLLAAGLIWHRRRLDAGRQ
ncbi:hypothetical protein K6I34_000270, partial [Streptomyces sp. UNOC14_S4]|nr:hypothetical protein [Streptomyces sp. UNOC14_S4]